MKVKDRIKELRRVLASELVPHPGNWRTHGPAQQDALRGLLAEIGYADALLVRELEDGRLQLIDGHLRAETTPHELVPVLVLDVNEQEAAKLLLSHDPLAAMAGMDEVKVRGLLDSVSTENPAVQQMFDRLECEARQIDGRAPREEIELSASFQVVVECQNEDQQRDVYQRLTGEGFSCRVMTL